MQRIKTIKFYIDEQDSTLYLDCVYMCAMMSLYQIDVRINDSIVDIFLSLWAI